MIRNYQSLAVEEETNTNAFPSKYEVVQSLIQEGSIKIKKETKDQSVSSPARSNALADKSLARSEISTECSPGKTLDSEDIALGLVEIIPKIRRKLKFSGKSILGFHKGEAANAQSITCLLL